MRSRPRLVPVAATLVVAAVTLSGCTGVEVDGDALTGEESEIIAACGADAAAAGAAHCQLVGGSSTAPGAAASLSDPDQPSVLPGRQRGASYDPPRKRPNVLMITADDASVADLKYMPHVRELVTESGTTFDNALAPTPICAPARASLLTGQYAHNHGVLTIEGQGGGFESFKDRNTLPVALHRAGYDTMFVGKYLNGYGEDRRGPRYVPPGWTQWRATVDPTTYNFMRETMNVNGSLRSYQRYSTDLLSEHATALLERPRRRAKPWFLWVNYVAPHHGGPVESDDPMATHPGNQRRFDTTVPAPRHRNLFSHLTLPRWPDLFESDTSDKPSHSPAQHRYTKVDKGLLREKFQQRVEALQAVDEAVLRSVAVLRRTRQLRNTVVVYSSDNGYAEGQHNIDGKLWYYREPLEVPLVMAGPGIPKGVTVSTTVTNPDLAVTIAAMAGAKIGRRVDGVNILPWLRQPTSTRVVPIEAYPVHGGRRPLYTGVRVGQWTYVRLASGQEELYNHALDPYELSNLRRTQEYRSQLRELRTLSKEYARCAGSSCPKQFYR